MTNLSGYKKFVGGALVLASAFTLAACGNNGNNSSNGGDSSSNDENKAPVELTFWHAMNGPHQEEITKLVTAFNDSQDDYKVVEQNQGNYDTLQQSIMAAGASGDLPTLAQITPGNAPDYAKNGLLIALDDLMTGDTGFSQEELDDIYPGFLDSSKYDGKTYAFPFSKSTRIMYYNQSILDEYDVEVPKTWDEVVALGEKMTSNSDDRVAMGFENSFEMEYETIAKQAGAKFIEPETLETDIAGDKSVEALQFVMDLIDKGYARTAGEDGYFSGPFARGESALYIGSSAGVSHVAEPAEESGIEWRTAEIPTYNDSQLTLFAGNDLGIFSSASEEQQAGGMAFIKFLLEPANTAEWAMATGYVPIRKSAQDEQDYKDYIAEHPEYEAANKELAYGQSETSFVGFGQFRNVLLETLDNVLSNKADVKESLQSLEDQTKTIITDNN